MNIRAPAKINLYLRIAGKRKDGYHLIHSLMVPIALYDEIEINRSQKAGTLVKITCDNPQVPTGKGNLVYRAARLFLKQSGHREGVAIRIRKRIPVGAGLGGGSTDAAATLIALNRVFRTRFTSDLLCQWGECLGADVPFFVLGHPAVARGIGERLKPVSGLPTLWLVVLYPGFPVSTRWVYKNLNFKLTKASVNTKLNLPLFRCEELAGLLVNDLEATTLRRYPRIAYLKERLIQEGATGALMAGSGSSVFGIFAEEKGAKRAYRRLRTEERVEAYVVRSLT
ncbi:MAG TPA: 4-(cytidine 5'-diphospho)-2-C-methyl-D-erythritol kinase [Candidatus Binatia bacterium]